MSDSPPFNFAERRQRIIVNLTVLPDGNIEIFVDHNCNPYVALGALDHAKFMINREMSSPDH